MKSWLVILSLLTLASPSEAALFLNLDFESANLPTVPSGQSGGFVPISEALPGWNGFVGSRQTSEVFHNDLTLSSAGISVLGPNWPNQNILAGNFTAALQSGFSPEVNGFTDASIAQFALIPGTTQSLQLRAVGINFSVSFAGQHIELTPIGSGANYLLYGADISAFAGQSGELRVTSHYTPDFRYNKVFVDAIEFSAQPVPEPSTWALLGLSSLLLAFSRRRSMRHN